MKVDLLDQHIVELLARDSGQSTNSIAKKLKVHPTTIRRRIKELVRNKVIRFVAAVDPVKMGFSLSAVIAFDVEPTKLKSAVKLLASRRDVIWCSTTTGRFDIIVLVRVASTDELSELLEDILGKVEGLRNSETFVCLNVEKRVYSLMYVDAG